MSYPEYYEKPIEETIRRRVSCRTYENRLLDEQDKERLVEFYGRLRQGLHGEKITFHLTEHRVEDLKGRRLGGYILFRNARSSIAGVIEKSEYQCLNCGYLGEHVVLKATELGLGTCWAGYYDPYLIKDLNVAENQIVPAILFVGYAAEKRSLVERVARFAIRASVRQPWDKLFFKGDFEHTLTREAAGPYAGALEMLRLAPSSGNTQPWRIVKEKDENVFHFFKKVVLARYEKKNLHDIDLGIAMCHFELGALNTGLQGTWEQHEHTLSTTPAGVHYVMTWKHGT
ncbi:hypothetical protein IBX73_10660 [candidate division WOR-3 bacterium]|nr:hypothetical protein [candidate division WOR-3 bacterium]